MLSLRGVAKRYGGHTALAPLDLDLAPGEFVALLGPNGAGKSTLFQLVAGLHAPSAGRIEVAGVDLRRDAPRALARLGVVFQQTALDLDLSVRRNLALQAALQGLPRDVARSRIEHGCARLGLHSVLDRRTRELSGGTRRKVELVRAGLHEPALLLMDEATVGLDLQSRRDLRAALDADVRERGRTVLWATHWVEEAETADRVLVLHQGRLLADGPPQAVTQALGGRSLEDAFVTATAATH